jgi:lipoate-protein ligase B
VPGVEWSAGHRSLRVLSTQVRPFRKPLKISGLRRSWAVPQCWVNLRVDNRDQRAVAEEVRLRQVEEALIRAVAPLGIVGERSTGYTGVWTGGRKLASIGVHARDWVTWHGFALNVTTDLSYFDLIVPCGIAAVQMTSIARELSTPAAAHDLLEQEVRERVAEAFGEVFSLDLATLDPAELTRIAAPIALV